MLWTIIFYSIRYYVSASYHRINSAAGMVIYTSNIVYMIGENA